MSLGTLQMLNEMYVTSCIFSCGAELTQGSTGLVEENFRTP